MIRKLKSGEYRLYSRKKDPKTGKRRNLGTFGTRAEAEKHERAVQYFKKKKFATIARLNPLHARRVVIEVRSAHALSMIQTLPKSYQGQARQRQKKFQRGASTVEKFSSCTRPLIVTSA